jgi:feruloyl esterase
MAGLGKTTADLTRYRRQFESFLAAAGKQGRAGQDFAPASARLREQTNFGANPGDLRMLTYVPDRLPAGAPLVVVLHGCTQTAESYNVGTGWSVLAERHGFALLLPEQRPSNNQHNCFNWFLPGDTRRESGEAKSIRTMIERIVGDADLDGSRIFVTGLSAGGAMASVMLATYPEVFAGGAIVAGLPYGTANNVQQALEAMYRGRTRPPREWGYLVRRASRHDGPWPKVSIWHGAADRTVLPANAGEILKQWTDLQGLPLYPSEAGVRCGHQYRVWRGADGEPVIESWTIAGMAHGVPIGTVDAEGACGIAGPFILDVGVSSSHHIARFWELMETPAQDQLAPVGRSPGSAPATRGLRAVSTADPTRIPPHAAPGTGAMDLPGVLDRALRAAGLVKR